MMVSVPLPDWVKEIRPHQEQAVAEIVEAFKTVDVVILEAPTGSGKTLIAELVRRELGLKTLYVASDNSLVDQFARDFPYAKVLKGRKNYETENFNEKTADDCTSRGPGDACWWCSEFWRCPYQIAKIEAERAPLAVTNTAFLLAEGNGPGRFSGQPLIIADEADTLESMLMGYVEYNVSKKRMEDFGMEEPAKGIHKKSLVAWLTEFAQKVMIKAQEVAKENNDTTAKKLRQLLGLQGDTERVAAELTREIERKQEGSDQGKWIRDYNEKSGGLILKPVMVDGYGTRKLWRHGRKWLLMSATIISADELTDSLGLPMDFAVVKVPMTFPKENREVIMAPVANVVYKEMDQAVVRLIHAIGVIAKKHPQDRILVHTVSYALAKKLSDGLRHARDIGPRRILTYTDGQGREMVLRDYKATPGAIMFAPSMSRGIDLPGDMCRVQVVAKTPFLSLGDAQVSRRTHMPGGDVWYAVQAIRDIVQMTGRAVRSMDDWAVTYILDQQFGKNLYRKNKSLFPDWWRESVISDRSVREFLL